MAVRSFLHYALEVPDQAVGQRYYEDFGLVDVTGGDKAVRLKPARQDREAVLLYEGPRKRLHHLCYGATGEDFARARAALRAAGVSEIDPPRGAPEGGMWIRDPDGNLVNVREEAGPDIPPISRSSSTARAIAAAGAARLPGARRRRRTATAGPRPALHPRRRPPDRLLHPGARAQAVGPLRDDDRLPAMQYGSPHAWPCSRRPDPGFHHASFQVGSVDEIAMGAVRMADRGWQPGWGLGRHVIGSNFFYYIRDPWGGFAEYYFDLDSIPEDCAWQPRDFPGEDSLYIWGPPVPDDFGENKEVA